MDKDQDIRDVLKEVSNAISRGLSAPEAIEKLEYLQQRGFQLFLVLEPINRGQRVPGANPVLPIQVPSASAAAAKPARQSGEDFALNEQDKDFLRTLKIKVD